MKGKAKGRRPRGSGCIYRKNGIWWIKYPFNGAPQYESSGSEDWDDADRLLKRRLGEIVTGRFAGLGPERVRMAELFNDVLEDYRLLGRASEPDVEARIRLHLAPAFGARRAADLGSQEWRRYIAKRREQGAAEATINRELAVVRRAFNLAAASELPKVGRVPKILSLKEDNVRTGFLEYESYLALRAALPVRLQALFVVGYHVGGRSSELRSITWPQVDLGAKEIRLAGSQTKNGKPRTLPIYGDMDAFLEIQKQRRDAKCPDCPWVFFNRRRPIGAHLEGWKEACAAVGLPGLLFHDLRRSAVRNLERAGVPRKVAMAITGHLTESVFRRYDIVTTRDLKMAGEKMGRYLAELAGAPAGAARVEKSGDQRVN